MVSRGAGNLFRLLQCVMSVFGQNVVIGNLLIGPGPTSCIRLFFLFNFYLAFLENLCTYSHFSLLFGHFDTFLCFPRENICILNVGK